MGLRDQRFSASDFLGGAQIPVDSNLDHGGQGGDDRVGGDLVVAYTEPEDSQAAQIL